MQDSQLLSAFHELSPGPGQDVAPGHGGAVNAPQLVFDACHVGVVLRAVLSVEVVSAVAAMYGTPTVLDWMGRTALFTGAALPATLLWLVAGCLLKRPLARLLVEWQCVAGVVLGGLAGLFGCLLLLVAGVIATVPWVAGGFTGALLSSALVAALLWRARGATPAATSARLAELQARIRPHFLFNTLNSAIALVRAEPAKAEALLEDLSDLFRHALEDLGQSATLASEVALAQRYLAIEEVRFGQRLRVEWALDPLADQAMLPPLLLQPLVENAVRHGVEPSDQGAAVRISTQRRGSTVVIKVTNTVPDGPGVQGHGVALANVRARLRLLHDVQGRFHNGLKDSLQGPIYQVRIEVPAPD